MIVKNKDEKLKFISDSITSDETKHSPSRLWSEWKRTPSNAACAFILGTCPRRRACARFVRSLRGYGNVITGNFTTLPNSFLNTCIYLLESVRYIFEYALYKRFSKNKYINNKKYIYVCAHTLWGRLDESGAAVSSGHCGCAAACGVLV